MLLFCVLCHVISSRWFNGLQLLHLPRRWSFLWLRINWTGFCCKPFFLLLRAFLPLGEFLDLLLEWLHLLHMLVKPVIVILDIFVFLLTKKTLCLTCSHLLHGMLGNICTECDSYKTRMIEKEVFWVLKIIIYDEHIMIMWWSPYD